MLRSGEFARASGYSTLLSEVMRNEAGKHGGPLRAPGCVRSLEARGGAAAAATATPLATRGLGGRRRAGLHLAARTAIAATAITAAPGAAAAATGARGAGAVRAAAGLRGLGSGTGSRGADGQQRSQTRSGQNDRLTHEKLLVPERGCLAQAVREARFSPQKEGARCPDGEPGVCVIGWMKTR